MKLLFTSFIRNTALYSSTLCSFKGIITAILILAGCAQDNQKLASNAAIQGRASSDAQIQAENNNLSNRSSLMETDLATRQRFYQALRGKYEGDLQTEQGTYKVRITLVPSLPPYTPTRVRLPEEIASDLNNLYFNAHVIQWNPANTLSSMGCRVAHIRPDINTGEVVIASENCPNLYTLALADSAPSTQAIGSVQLASRILQGSLQKITELLGEIQPSTNSAIYHFKAQRIEE